MQCIKAVQHTAKYQDAKNYVRFVLSEIKKKNFVVFNEAVH